MSRMSRHDIEQLEHDLRAVRTDFDDIEVSPDAWRRNEELVAAASARGGRRALVAVAAGVVALLVVGLSWVAVGGRDDAADVPGSGPERPVGDLPMVEVARVDLPDGHLSAGVGLAAEGRVCSRLTSDGMGTLSEGCAPGEADADDPEVSFDYLRVGGSEYPNVAGFVDERTNALVAWAADGTRTELPLVEVQGTALRAFGVISVGPESTWAQRLVAYADAEATQVLEAVDLAAKYSGYWLPSAEPGCAGVQRVPSAELPGGVTVRASFVDAEISYTGTGGGTREVCRPMTEAPVAAVRTGDQLVLVLAPEVAAIRLDGEGRLGPARPAEQVGTTMWRATVRQVQDLAPEDTLEFLDESGTVLQRLPVRWII